MSLSIGIVGLPNVGKSTLFNALLKRQAALAANYPFATIEPNIGIVDVPDSRLQVLYELVEVNYHAQPQIIPATVKFFDIAGLVAGAHKGEGLGNQFLSHIREVSAIAHVVRDFTDENVIRAGSIDPKSDIETINTELLLADIQTIDKRLESRKFKDDHPFLARLKSNMEQGIMVKDLEWAEDEQKYIWELGLLSAKPILLVLNVDENNLKQEDEPYIRISAKVEAELASFDEKEKKDYLQSLGVEESGLDKIIKKGFEILGLQTYLTAGPKEVRAWTIRKGAKAPEAAGVIHTDFEKGFIKAEIVSFEDLVKVGGWKQAKDKGLLRLEGKEYEMREGDVVEFRFNV